MAERIRLIAINGNAGATVAIFATGPTRVLNINEDDKASRTGLTIQTFQDNFVSVNNYATTAEPINIPDVQRNPGKSELIGMNAQGVSGAFNYRAADKLVIVISPTSGATTARVIEND